MRLALKRFAKAVEPHIFSTLLLFYLTPLLSFLPSNYLACDEIQASTHNFAHLSIRADFKSPISATSVRPTPVDTGTDTAIMPDTCTETKLSPSTLTDPPAEGNRELKPITSTQCDTFVENVIMPETHTAPGPKSTDGDLFSPPAQENLQAGTGATWDMPAQYDSDSDSDIQTVIFCDSPSESDSPQISSSSQKEANTISSTSSDDSPDDSSDDSSVGSSSGSSNSSSGVKSEPSFDRIDTSPKSPHIALFNTSSNTSSQQNCKFQTSTTSEKLAEYDSDSDVQTVILCDDTSENDTNTLQNSSSSQKEPNTISSTSPDDSPDDSSVGSSSWASDSSCGAKSESSSIDSFYTSSRHDSESEEEDPPKGSQMLAAYASPLRDGHRIRTSCDSIHDPGRWQVDPDGFINERYRAGGPFLLTTRDNPRSERQFPFDGSS
ncbi:unnamed protein product [Penicillium palitans]